MANDLPLALLLIEDDSEFRVLASKWLERKGHRVCQASSCDEARTHLKNSLFDVIVLDLNLPDESGLAFLKAELHEQSDAAIVILTGEGTVETAVDAMKLGASDYLTKPFPLPDLEHRLRLAADRSRLQIDNRRLLELLKRKPRPIQMVGDSAGMKEVARLIERAAPTDKAILIQGESGTGKELAVQAIVERSLRRDRPFVTINCAALPESLVESELFGHEKGAFTGATMRKHGLFEIADGGTLFIDEIGELPLALQPKLLRVLENGWLRRVGSHQERRVDVRLLAATNRDLSKEVAAGRFREDLFYRINVMVLQLPPLRERIGDISQLIDHFLPSDWEIDHNARLALEQYSWPGNIRQLINVLDRAMILGSDRCVAIEDLPPDIVPSGSLYSDESHEADSHDLATIERAHIQSVLEQVEGNKAKAARLLGIHRRKLYRLLERLGIS